MLASAIRSLAATDESSIVAAAFFEKTVQIWSSKTGQQLGEFQTMFDFGGRRLALTPDGSTCIVGAWGQLGRGARGLGAYSIPDGKLLWNRKDIRRIQDVRLSGSGQEIYCGVQDASAHIIETSTGETIRRVRATEKIVGSQYTPNQVIEQKRGRYLVRGGCEFEIQPLSSALLDAAFSPDAVCLSELRDSSHPSEIGGIRLIDLATGESCWHVALHSSRLTYNLADQKFYCVSRERVAPHNWFLTRLQSDLLKCEQKILDKCWDAAFTPSGRVLVTAQGDVYETSTSTILAHLDFPQRVYPDA
jgi:hypothetical protein